MPDSGLPTAEELEAIWTSLLRHSGYTSERAVPEPAELVDADWRLGWE